MGEIFNGAILATIGVGQIIWSNTRAGGRKGK